jgi:hypothetical protein
MLRNDLVDAYREYRRRYGFWCVPVVGKDPGWLGKGWHTKRLEPEALAELLRTHAQVTGIGVILGPSGVVDLEADCMAAEAVLNRIAPPTDCRWEHAGRGHRVYRSAAAHREWNTPPFAQAGTHKGALVEVRAGNHQSVLPPSLHPDDGLPYTFTAQGAPAEVPALALYRAGSLAAAAGALAAVWGSGSRQNAALALSGYFRRAGITQDEAEAVLEAICRAAEDDETPKRLRALRDTYESLGKNLTGLPKLKEIFGEGPVSWLNAQFPRTLTHPTPAPAVGANGKHPEPETRPWESPLDLGDSTLPEFPVDVLPDWAADYVRALSHATQTPVDLAAVLVLAVVAGSLAGKVWVQLWEEPLNLYLVTVLPSGERKSAVMRAASAPVREYEAELRALSAPEIAVARNRLKIAEARLARAQGAAAKAEGPQRETLAAEADELARELLEIEVPAEPRLLADDATVLKDAGCWLASSIPCRRAG